MEIFVLNCSNSNSQLETPLLRSATLSITNKEACFFSMSAKLLIQKHNVIFAPKYYITRNHLHTISHKHVQVTIHHVYICQSF